MARWMARSRRFGMLFMGLMLAMGVIGAQVVGASNIVNPPLTAPGAGQPPQGICLPCMRGIKNLQEKTFLHPGDSLVEITFDFVGDDDAGVSYSLLPANMTPSPYWHLPQIIGGHFKDDEYLTTGGHYEFYVTVLDKYGNSYSKALDFWVT